MTERVRVVMLTNIPVPYRNPVYAALAQDPSLDFHVLFCAGSEPDRNWHRAPLPFPHTFLAERFFTFAGRFIHANPGVWKALRTLRPDVVITTGYNPSHLTAFAYARRHGCAHVVMTDGTLRSEGSSLTAVHRWVRRIVMGGSQAFIGACQGSFALFDSFGVPREKMFQSHLCADNAAFLAGPAEPKQYDLLFSGRFVAIKNPLFALDVASHVAAQLGRRVSIAFLGAGELEPAMREHAVALAGQVDARFLGFAQPGELPEHYKRARIFLFPTSWDPWGVVANEASVAGVPVVVTPMAGAAGEIVQDDVNGFVLPLDVEAWCSAVCRLLTDEALYQRMHAAGPQMAAPYTYQHAAEGVSQAVHAALGRRAGR